MTDRITTAPPESEVPDTGQPWVTTWCPVPTYLRTAEVARRFGRAERTMRSRALDHPGIAQKVDEGLRLGPDGQVEPTDCAGSA